MIKDIVRITTDDTGKTYEFPGENNPNIFAVEVRIKELTVGGKGTFNAYDGVRKIVHLEERTLQHAGLTLQSKAEKKIPPTETATDLILRLLEMCEVYPAE